MSRSQNKKEIMPNVIIREKIEKIQNKRYIFSVMIKAAMFMLAIYIVFSQIFGITTMKNSDMMPRLSAGDLVLYYRLNESYYSPDIVVFDVNGEEYIGRVIAIPGESIEITDSYIINLNGNRIIEDDIFYKTYKYGDNIEYPLNLNDDEYFIMCDSREGAKDSRYFGPIQKDNIKGCIVTVLRRNNL